MIKTQLKQVLAQALDELGLPYDQIELKPAADLQFGDYASNLAMQAFPTLEPNVKKRFSLNSPRELAQLIVNQLNQLIQQNQELQALIEKVEVAGPGFINFYLSNQPYLFYLEQILSKKQAPIKQIDPADKQKIIVEYSSPNIAKPFTIGHLRSTIIGDSIANLLEARGYQVFRDNHVGDWGTQFGKQIYAIKTWGDEQQIEQSNNPVKELVKLYVKFHQEAEKDTSLIDQGRFWFKKLEEGDEEARRLWHKCIDWSWQEFDKIYQKLGVSFTENKGRGYGESFFEDKMDEPIAQLDEKGLLQESKGAQLVFFPNEEYPPLMIIKQDGATLYSTRDLATDWFRLQHYGENLKIINEVGAEQSLYFQQLFKVEQMLGWFKLEQRVHLKHGLYRFDDKKMSTREGNVIWLQDVLQEAFSRVDQIAQTRIDDQAKWKIAIGALKWNDLKRKPELSVIFDWDEIICLEGNSGPYVQYTYTRALSVLQKADKADLDGGGNLQSMKHDLKPAEVELLKYFYLFNQAVLNCEQDLSMHHLANYLFELAQLFNSFYNQCPILQADDSQSRQFRLALTRAAALVLEQGLGLMGIETLSKM